MIVKQRDAQRATIEELERSASNAGDTITRSACGSAAARLRSDVTTERAALLIDRQFGPSDEWAVIHDLRLKVGSHAVQINHVLINASLSIVCLDTRYINHGLLIDRQGACQASKNGESQPIASPLNKLAKDVRMLRSLLQQSDILPKRFCITRRATVSGHVLTYPGQRLQSELPDSAMKGIGLATSDALLALLWKRDLRCSKLLGSSLSPYVLRQVAERLVARHTPVFSHALLRATTFVNDSTRSILASNSPQG